MKHVKCIAFFSMFFCFLPLATYGTVVKIEEVKFINIIYHPSPHLRDNPLKISIKSEGMKKILIKKINKSKASSKSIKEALVEGNYKIYVNYGEDKIQDVFSITSSGFVYWENRDKNLKNEKLLVFIRSILFDELINRGIKIQKCPVTK